MYINVTSPTDAQKLSSMLNSGDWLVLYYADWCGHCKDMKPEWHKTVEQLKTSRNIHVGEIESSHIPSLTHKPEIAGFPTIKMYNHGKEVANFDNQPRISQNITKFAMDNSSKSHHAPKLQAPVTKPHHSIKAHHVTKHHKSHKSSRSHSRKTHSHHKRSHKTHSHHKRSRKTHSHKSYGTTMKRMMNKEKATKDVFGELIKSFSRIGKEARTDAQLLKEAKSKL